MLGTATGNVRLWGRVTVCRRGLRATRAYPAELRLVDRGGAPGARELAAYGVPVAVVPPPLPARSGIRAGVGRLS